MHVPVLARVEGEGALELELRDGRVTELKLRIYEPPRLFEKFLEGRSYGEVLDTVARICGICPIAYQMSAAQALEGAFGLDPGDWVRRMRRLFYCGEWIESHALHIHLLALPDFLGYDNALALSRDYPDEVRRGVRLQGLGNEIIRLLGARSVHPVGARVGGFAHAPRPEAVAALLERLRAAVPEVEALTRFVAGLALPRSDQDFTSVALRHPGEYPMIADRIVSDRGLDISVTEWDAHFAERHVAHSTALHCLLHDEPYLVGPLARVNLHQQQLPPEVLAGLEGSAVRFPSRNLFHSIVARALELHYAFLQAIGILEDYREPQRPDMDVTPRVGTGYGATEAPRGVLWHTYDTDDQGLIRHARIVPPTSQNQARIETDLRLALQEIGLEHSDDELRRHSETVIRNYDPCISCATHFLDLRIRRA